MAFRGFSDLPAKTQTAIADVFFQYGTGDPARAAPIFWRQITTGQWGDDKSYPNARKPSHEVVWLRPQRAH